MILFVRLYRQPRRVSGVPYLQKARELDHTPAESGHVWLHQTHLVNIDSQEPLDHAAVLGGHRARDQVAVVWEEADGEQNEALSGGPAWRRGPG